MQVKTYKKVHKCRRAFKNHNLTSWILAHKYVDQIRNNPKIPIQASVSHKYNDYKSDVNGNQEYKVVVKGMRLIESSHIEQHAKL